jgi:hypothetical protein
VVENCNDIKRNGISRTSWEQLIERVPPHSETTFYNYKQTFSVVLVDVVVANYTFVHANVGIQGRISDVGVFKYTSLYEKLLTKSLNIPQLPDRTKETPFVL